MIIEKRTPYFLLFSIFISCSQSSSRNVRETSTEPDIIVQKVNNDITPRISLVRVIGSSKDDEHFSFHKPYDLALDSNQNRYIVDSGNRRIQKYDRNWNFITMIDNRFRIPRDIHIDERDNIFIGDWGHKEIIMLGRGGRRNRGQSRLSGFYNNVFQFLQENFAVSGGLEVLSQGDQTKENLILQFYDLYGRKVSGFGART